MRCVSKDVTGRITIGANAFDEEFQFNYVGATVDRSEGRKNEINDRTVGTK